MAARRPIPLTETLIHLRWLVPLSIAVLGLAYAVGDHLFFSRFESSQLHIIIGALALGILTPIFAWRVLGWAAVAARERDAAERELEARNEKCSTINAIAGVVNRSLELDEVLNLALDHMLQLLRLETGDFRMLEGDQLVPRVQRGLSLEALAAGCQADVGECLCGQAAVKGETLMVGNLDGDHPAPLRWCRSQQYRSILCIPVRSKDKIKGVLHLASRTPREFAPMDQDILVSIAYQIGVAIEKAQLYAQVQDLNHRLEQRVETQAVELEGARSEIAAKARQLQELLIETISLQEKERARIAYDMHDRAAQLIIGSLYQIQAARQCVAADSEVAPLLQTAQTMLKDSETAIRQAIYDLRPPALDAQGLEAALRIDAGRHRELTGLRCAVNSLGATRRLQNGTEIAVYRIVQEALTNISRHAGATHAEITLDYRGPNLCVTVADDGRGFDAGEIAATETPHLGLIGMRERALAIRGELRVLSQRGQGTRVLLTVPLKDTPPNGQ